MGNKKNSKYDGIDNNVIGMMKSYTKLNKQKNEENSISEYE